MTIAKGIKGIRKFLNTEANHKGWQVVLNDQMTLYMDDSFYGIVSALEYLHTDLVFHGSTGNTLCFASNGYTY